MLFNVLLDTQPLDIWHDTVFQLIVVVIATLFSAFIGGAIAIWVYRRQKSRKEITYQVVSDAPIASINQTVADKVEIRFDGHPIKEAHILVLKVWNSGNVAVKRDDYEEPITFIFHGRTVISCDILETVPTNLIDQKTIKTFLTFNGESVEISKFLLNPQQSISITTLLTGAKNTISVRARIIDGKVIELNPDRPSTFKRYLSKLTGIAWLAVMGAFLGFSVFLFIAQIITTITGSPVTIVGTVPIVLVGLLTLIVGESLTVSAVLVGRIIRNRKNK